MLFNFTTWNHCRQGQIIVEDITRALGEQIKEIGHVVTWDDSTFLQYDAVSDGAWNVVLESFADDPATIRRISEAHAAGCRFIIVATEEPSPQGFNAGLDPAMTDRQRAFPEAARFADGILHLVPGAEVTRWYSQHAPAAYAEIGYASGSINGEPDREPDADFGFYGKMTWRRGQMLDRLSRHGTIVRIKSLDVPRRDRDRAMRRAKVIVQIRANEEWGMVSSTRCASALCFGRPVIAEPHPSPEPWSGIVDFSRTVDEFFHDADSATTRWRELHERQFDRFRETLTADKCVGVPLRKIGIIK